jgi:hypothetical protein
VFEPLLQRIWEKMMRNTKVSRPPMSREMPLRRYHLLVDILYSLLAVT